MPTKKKYIWEKKTDTELQFWPRKSTEHYLSAPTLPKHLVKKRTVAKVSAPEGLPFDILRAKGIINSASTVHWTSYYQSRAKESFSIIVFTVSGSARVKINKRKYKLTRGTFFIAPANSEYVLRTNEKWSNIWFHLDDSLRWSSVVGTQAYVKKSRRIGEIKSAVDMWLKEVYKRDRSVEFLELIADTIVFCLRDELRERKENTLKLEDVILQISHSGLLNLSAVELAERLGYSLHFLDKICMQERSLKFAKILLSIKMKKACEILRTGGSINDASTESGYADRTSFSKAFKRYFGISPSEFK